MGHQYVNGQKGQKRGYASNEEITAAFIKAGWIGKRRVPHPKMRLVPFFDIGPGPDIGR